MTRSAFTRDRPSAKAQGAESDKLDHSIVLFRNSLASAVLTLILLPGGVRAFMQFDQGWEAWSFARYIIVPVIAAHLIFCWVPLAAKYFRRGTCRDVPAFAIASMTLYVQCFICYALFESYARWHGLS